MALMPGPVVAAPQPRGLRYGLITAANGPLELPPHGAGGGVRYDPLSCGVAYTFPVECDDTPPSKTFDDGDTLVTASPLAVYAGYVCGAAGYDQAYIEAKVRRRLENGEQGAVEAALADLLAAASPTPLVAPDPTSIASVFGDAEQWLYGQVGYGQVGYIHAPLRYAAAAGSVGVLVRDGVLWRTHLGTIVVFGDYPDTGVLYVTGQVTLWRSTEVDVPALGQILDRSTNQQYALAERAYAVAWDCHTGAITYDPDEAIS